MYHHNLACPPQTTHPVITLPLAQPGNAVLLSLFFFYNDDAKNCTGDGPDMGRIFGFVPFAFFWCPPETPASQEVVLPFSFPLECGFLNETPSGL